MDANELQDREIVHCMGARICREHPATNICEQVLNILIINVFGPTVEGCLWRF